MANWFTRRGAFWKSALFHPVRAGMGLIIALIGFLVLLRDAVLPPEYRDWFLLKLLPNLSWYSWAIIILSATLLLVLEGAYAVHRSEVARLRTRHRTRVAEIRAGMQQDVIFANTRELVGLQRAALAGREKQEESAQTEAQHQRVKKMQPNLVWLAPEEVPAHNEGGVIVLGEASESETFRTVVAPYHNSPRQRRKVGRADNVNAQIIYKYFDKQPPLIIRRGAWLSEKESKVDFGWNDTRRVIIATIEGKDDSRVCAIRRDFDSSYKGVQAKREELHGDLFGVTVRLITEQASKILIESEYILEIVRQPEIKVTLRDLNLWRVGRLIRFIEQVTTLIERHQSGGEAVEGLDADFDNWESSTADFLDKHFGESHKKRFLEMVFKRSGGVPDSSEPYVMDRYERGMARVDALTVSIWGAMRQTSP